MDKVYKYDAFISYRHAELDKFVAENLHRRLESYKISKKVLSNGRARRSKIERVFRDKDELPITNNLEDPIIQALSQSEYLIVICTPRLKESIWCKKEIETFISMHGRDKIFAVLAEGEPYESFPEEILYREEPVYYPDGSVGTRLVPVEPLAADVRGKTKKEILKAMDVELLRLLAPMLGVDFDDLRQRHRERKFKKIITATLVSAVICLGIGVASTIAALHINKQKEQIETQSVEIQAQADEIASQSDAIQAQNELLLDNQAVNLAQDSQDLLNKGDRMGAVDQALSAVTEYQGILMPYTPQAQYALTESLYAYDAGNHIKPMYQMVMPSTIEKFTLSPDKSKVACVDSIGTIGVWDLNSADQITAISQNTDAISFFDSVDFLDDNHIVYISGDGALVKYNLVDNTEECRVALDESADAIADGVGKNVIVSNYSNVTVFDASGEEFVEIASFYPAEGYTMTGESYISDKGLLVYVERKQEDIEEILNDSPKDMADYCLLHIYDTNQKVEKSVISVEYDGVNTVCFDGDYVYYAAALFTNQGSQILVKYDVNKNEPVWEIETETMVSKICLPNELGDNILALGSLEAFSINENTGEQISRIDSANSIVNAQVIDGYNSFEIFTLKSDYGQYHVDNDTYVIYEDYFEKNFEDVSDFEISEYGYVVKALNDNKLTYYELSLGSDIALYEREVNSSGIGILEENVGEVSKTMQLEKANLVETIMYSDDKSIMFVSYTDSTLEIYNVSDKQLLAVLEDIEDDINVYYGKDKNENTYIGNYYHGYILDKEYNLIAKPESLREVNFEGELLIVEVGDEYGCFPIYSIDELVNKAMQLR